MEIISDLAITGQEISLDDKHFRNCTLTNCQLSYGGGGVILERTALIGCRHRFSGSARSTILYLQRIGLMEEDAKWTDTEESVH